MIEEENEEDWIRKKHFLLLVRFVEKFSYWHPDQSHWETACQFFISNYKQ